MDRGCLRVAMEEDFAGLTARFAEIYGTSRDFVVTDPEYYGRHGGVVLVAERAGRIVGTIAAGVGEDARVFAGEDEGAGLGIAYPTLYLRRTFTDPGVRARGLNGAMRLHLLQAAMRMGLGSLTGVVHRGTARTRTMAELGYEFRDLMATGSASLEYKTPSQFVWLDLERSGEEAKAKLEAACKDALEEFPWVGQDLVVALKRHAAGG